MTREIVLDTETTGLDARNGDRLIEIGCVELRNHRPTGQEFHRYLNPEREVPAEAEAVHGLSTAFLKDKPLFSSVAKEFLAFIGDDTLVIHNASFDLGFLNAELERLRLPPIAMSRVTDTLPLARRKHPGAPNNLNALCKRYGIDATKRTKHGALVDSLLLAEVYIELLGVRQTTLALNPTSAAKSASGPRLAGLNAARPRPQPLASRLDGDTLARHHEFVATLGPQALWLRYSSVEEKMPTEDCESAEKDDDKKGA